jgi:hypothetical protein
MSAVYQANPIKPLDWRDHLDVHPAADLFPLMSETDPAALKELAEDIKKNGQREPASYIKDSDGNRVLLDGRNRLDALEMLGRKIDINDSSMFEQRSLGINAQAFIISKNIHRRHLNAEDKRNLIAKLLKAKPENSNRQIANQVKVDHKTVATVRKEKEATGEIPQLKKTVGADGKKRSVIQPKKSTRRLPTARSSEAMPTAAEAEESYQETLYNQACLLLESMASETRQRFFAHTSSTSARIPVPQTKVEDNWAGNDLGDDEETCWRRGLIHRAAESAGHAAYEDWSKFKVDSELVAAATRAAEAWNQTAAYLRSIQNEQEAERGANPDDGLTIPDNLKRAAP